jgi:hypothetical protein
MKTLSALTLIVVLSVAGCHSSQTRLAGYAQFGAPHAGQSVLTISQAIEQLNANPGKPVTVEATVDEVCAKRGCWMLIEDGAHHVRVRFTASEQCTDGFLVPRNASGHKAVVSGVLKHDVITQDMARHYAEDAGKSPAEIARIVGDQPAVTMIATSVMISEAERLDPPVQ